MFKKTNIKTIRKPIKDAKKSLKKTLIKNKQKIQLKRRGKKGAGERGGGAHRMSIGETRLQITQNIRGLHTTNQLGYSSFVFKSLHWFTYTGEGVSL